MADDPRKPRRAQSTTDRELTSLIRLREQRRAERDQADRMTRAELDAQAAPKDELFDQDTGVTTRIMEDQDLRILASKAAKNRQAIDVTRREVADLIVEVAGERPPEERFGAIERKVKIVHWILTALAIPAITSFYLVAKYLYSRGAEDQHNADRIDQLERDLQETRDLARHNATLLERSGLGRDTPDVTTPKDHKP